MVNLAKKELTRLINKTKLMKTNLKYFLLPKDLDDEKKCYC